MASISKPLHPQSSKWADFISKAKDFQDLEAMMTETYPTKHSDIKKKLGINPRYNNLSEAQRKEVETISSTNSNICGKGIMEVFAEGYFKIIVGASAVVPEDSFTKPIRNKYKLPSIDIGADGAFTKDGIDTLYQVKYSSDKDKKLSYKGSNGLVTFFAATNQCSKYGSFRCVFTNAADMPQIPKSNQDNWYSITGADLRELTPSQYKSIANWIKTGVNKVWLPKKPTMRKHQLEARKQIKKFLKQGDRAYVEMACGSGKTFTAADYCVASKANKILVLVPSVELAKQTRLEFSKFNLPHRQLTVCHKKNIHAGDFDLSDLNFAVTTDPQQLGKNLKGAKQFIIFCVYNSAKVVQDACRKHTFDLAIFDEAHHTAGRVNCRDALALYDRNIKISKRLFLTATPAIYDASDSSRYNSMDNETVYGPRAYHLSFSEAVKRKIITPWKIVVSAFTREDVDNELLKNGEVILSGEAVRPEQVAAQLGIAKIAKDYDVKKIITYHGSINKARSFTCDRPEGISTHLKGFDTDYISCYQTAGECQSIMQQFRNPNSTNVLATVDKLNEGVDVPAVDMVSFIDPIMSKRNIVQRGGRAVRNHEWIDENGNKKTKKFGIIHLNVFVEPNEGETVGEALVRAKFDHVRAVLEAMREEDDSLNDLLVIAAENLARTGEISGYTQSLLDDRVDFIRASIPLRTLRESISYRALEEVVDEHEVMYQKYADQNKAHHNKVAGNRHQALTQNYNTSDSSLLFNYRKCPYSKDVQEWIARVRKYYCPTHHTSVPAWLTNALDADPRWRWSEMHLATDFRLAQAQVYIELHKKDGEPCYVPSKDNLKDPMFVGFHSWFKGATKLKKDGSFAKTGKLLKSSKSFHLTYEELREQLQNMGFSLDSNSKLLWLSAFEDLKLALEACGGWINYKSNGISNKRVFQCGGTWNFAMTTLKRYQNNKLEDWQAKEWEDYGLPAHTPDEERWLRSFNLYCEYTDLFTEEQLFPISSTEMLEQSQIFDNLPDNKKTVPFSPTGKKGSHKHEEKTVSAKYWVKSFAKTMRLGLSKHAMPPHRIQKLNEMRTKGCPNGFHWDGEWRVKDAFQSNVDALKRICLKFGQKNVIDSFSKMGSRDKFFHSEEPLRDWIVKQRYFAKKGELSVARRNILVEAFGEEFFNDSKSQWQKDTELYTEYVNKTGLKTVPPLTDVWGKFEEDWPHLRDWFQLSMTQYRKSNCELSADKLRDLVKVNFPFEMPQKQRDEELKQLRKLYFIPKTVWDKGGTPKTQIWNDKEIKLMDKVKNKNYSAKEIMKKFFPDKTVNQVTNRRAHQKSKRYTKNK